MKCAIETCQEIYAGKSKYCKVHRAEAHDRWAENIRSKSAEKDEREKKWQALYENAYQAGMIAGKNSNPTPMIVGQDDGKGGVDHNQETFYVSEGVCGFAWVSVRPGNCSFARWVKKMGYGRTDSYAGGVTIWISEFNQSMDRKEKCARAMADVFRAAGIEAYCMSRMD